MSLKRSAASAPGAAHLFLLLGLLLLVPANSLAWPGGTPVRGMVSAPAAPANPTAVAGTDGNWSELPPPQMEETPAVYDPVRQSMLFFGGRVPNTNSYTNDVWELSLSGPPTWTLLATAGAKPLPRGGHVLLYDSRLERLLVFGGTDSMSHNDCWALDLTTIPPQWSQGFPTGTPPSRRSYCQAVYDSLNDRAILFGGADSISQNGGPTNVRADVWVLPLTDPLVWSEITPAGSPPSARAAGAVIHDKARQQMVLFGGYDGAIVLGDAFTLSLGVSPAWAPLAAAGGPPPARAIPGVILEAPQDRMVMFGGIGDVGGGILGPLGDLWVLDLATPAWTPLSTTGSPPSVRQSPAAVYDPPRDRMMLYGGDAIGTVQDPFWSLSLNTTPTWTDLGGHRPPRRWEAASVVDPTRQVMWIHGGDAYDNSGRAPRTDLWKLTLQGTPAWSQPATTGTPLGRRIGHSAVYDALRDRLVFFGGTDTISNFNNVRTLTLSGTPAWGQISPSGTPPAARKYHSAVYDVVNDRMVVFGGATGTGNLNDVWSLSFAGTPAWSQLAPSGAPPPGLWGQSAALDRDANRLIVFGGSTGGRRNNVYALTLTGSPVWTELFPAGTPPAGREFASMVSLGTRMLVSGGSGGGGWGDEFSDTWLLSLYPTPSWRQLDVGPILPSARSASCSVFDQGTFRLVTFGGTGNSNPGAETWILQLDQAVPALASLVSANAKPGRVDLAWEVSSPLTPATLYRSLGDGAWTVVGLLTADGTGRLVYVDDDVIAGQRYGYRLGLTGGGGEVLAGEVWVEVPEEVRFTLRGLTPNPGRWGDGLVTFSLADDSPARLEVVDVSGRRVFAREVGALGRGEHVVRVSGAEPLAPGVYLVRLTQAGRSLFAKAVTIR